MTNPLYVFHHLIPVFFLLLISDLLTAQSVFTLPSTADTVKIENWLEEASVLWRKGDYEGALPIAQKALATSRDLFGEKNIYTAYALVELATIYGLIKKYELALELVENALSICAENNEIENTICGEAYFEKAVILGRMYKHETVFENFEKALAIFNNTLDQDDPTLGDLFMDIGTNYYRIGDFESAYHNTKKAVLIYQKIPGEKYSKQLNRLYINLGILCQNMGKLHDAILYYEQAKIEAQKNDYPVPASLYANLGITYRLLERYEEALSTLQKAISLYGTDSIRIARVYNNMGNVMISQRNGEDALKYHLISLAIKKELLPKENPGIARSYMNIGVANYLIGDYEQALSYLNNSFELFSLIVGIEHPLNAAISGQISEVHIASGDYDAAWEHINQASKVLNYDPNRPLNFGVVKDLTVLRKLLVIKSDYYKSLHSREKSEFYLDSLYFLNEVQIGLEDFIQKNFINPNTKEHLLSEAFPVYENAIHNLITATDVEKINRAFELSEKTKSRQLSEKIRGESYTQTFGLPDSLRHREYETAVRISYYEKRKFQEENESKVPNDSLLNVYQDNIFRLRQQWADLQNVFREDYQSYHQLKYNHDVVTVKEVQSGLNQNESLIEYFVGDSLIYLFLIQKDNYKAFSIELDFDLEALVDSLKTGLYGYYSVSEDNQTDQLYRTTKQTYTTIASELYQLLLSPVAGELTDVLIIVPDAALRSIPFEVLLNRDILIDEDYSSYPYLLRDHSVSYAYSATLLKEMRQKKHQTPPLKNVLAVAPFNASGYSQTRSVLSRSVSLETIDTSYGVNINSNFPTLESSGPEVQEVVKIWGGDYFLDPVATEDLFIDTVSAYRIIHLATHGQADYNHSDFSFLAFTQIPDSLENELLYVRDIYNLKLNADLVVLSACNTAVGDSKRGEGVISLARAFAYVGAKSMLTTLWLVNDITSKDIVIDFHRNLQAGLSKDLAIQKAKLKYLREAKINTSLKNIIDPCHPYFWASFIIIGDTSNMN